jgi:hypothetical protein
MAGPEDIDYEGFTLRVRAYGPSDKVLIYPPGSDTHLQLIPTRPIGQRDQLIEDAKTIVGAHITEVRGGRL